MTNAQIKQAAKDGDIAALESGIAAALSGKDIAGWLGDSALTSRTKRIADALRAEGLYFDINDNSAKLVSVKSL